MTDSGLVLVDTNVILDVTQADPQWLDWSVAQVSRFPSRLIVNPLIYTELCYQAGNTDEVDAIIVTLGLQYLELPKEALFLASQAYQAYQAYRRRGGIKTCPLPDFFIGAHAQALGIPILTRDEARYRTNFPNVELICP